MERRSIPQGLQIGPGEGPGSDLDKPVAGKIEDQAARYGLTVRRGPRQRRTPREGRCAGHAQTRTTNRSAARLGCVRSKGDRSGHDAENEQETQAILDACSLSHGAAPKTNRLRHRSLLYQHRGSQSMPLPPNQTPKLRYPRSPARCVRVMSGGSGAVRCGLAGQGVGEGQGVGVQRLAVDAGRARPRGRRGRAGRPG